MKKRKFAFLLALVLLVAVCAAACGNNAGPAAGEVVFEAEGINLAGLSGHGYSNEASECGMIQGQNTKSVRENASVLNSISNSYFVGFFTTPGTTLTFDFTADKASAGNTMKLRMGSEYGTMKIDPSVMTIKVNGTELAYSEISVRGKKLVGLNIVYGEPFKDYEVSAEFDLVQGANKIELTIKQNSLGIKDTNVESVGPGIDCIKVKSGSALTWSSLWDANKAEIQVEG